MAEAKKTILIIDDQPANLKVLLSFLKKQRFHIRVDISGERALRSLEKEQPDLILLDVMMPGMDGFETCKQIKANPTLADIPLIFMTALDSVEDKIAGFAAGAVDYITKPFHQDEVLARVNTHITLRSREVQLNELSATLEKRVAKRTAELEASNRRLHRKQLEVEEKNIALRVVLEQKQVSNEELEERIPLRLQKLITPYLDLLQKSSDGRNNQEYTAIIRSHLEESTKVAANKADKTPWNLSPKEVVVADFVKQGKSTKEIGRLLHISPRTAERHRNNIRKKAGLQNKKIRLCEYLRDTL